MSFLITSTLPDWHANFDADHNMMLSALPSRTERPLWIMAEHGKVRSRGGMKPWFAEPCQEVRLVGLAAYKLWKARASILAEMGGPAHQTDAWMDDVSLGTATHDIHDTDRKRVLGERTMYEWVKRAMSWARPKTRSRKTKGGAPEKRQA